MNFLDHANRFSYLLWSHYFCAVIDPSCLNFLVDMPGFKLFASCDRSLSSGHQTPESVGKNFFKIFLFVNICFLQTRETIISSMMLNAINWINWSIWNMHGKPHLNLAWGQTFVSYGSSILSLGRIARDSKLCLMLFILLFTVERFIRSSCLMCGMWVVGSAHCRF